MRICLAQLPVSRNVEANLTLILGAIEHAAHGGADILLTPEGSLSGYTHDFPRDEVSAAIETVRGAAAAHSVGLALGTCCHDPVCKNQIRLYDRSGRFVGAHSKILRCAALQKPDVGELYQFGTDPLGVFEVDGHTVGALICNDLWANPECTTMDDPHLTQRLSNMGARLILHAVNGGRNGSEHSMRVTRNYHESNLLMRARAAGVPIATVDNCEPGDLPCSSPGGIVSPAGEWLHRLPDRGESIEVFEINL